MSNKIMLTAGYDRALHVIVLAELLRRDGVDIAGILVVTPYQFKRLRGMVRQRGWTAVKVAARKSLGTPTGAGLREKPGVLAHYARSAAVKHTSLRKWARGHDIPFRSVNSLNDPKSLQFLRSTRAAAVIYGGGGILRKAFIEAVEGRVLNAHSGPLPEVRGMNACEWSLLRGLEPCVTIHLIDTGIDTGPILEKTVLESEPGDTVEMLRDKCALLGIQLLRAHANTLETLRPTAPEPSERGRQSFVLAPALREILDERLARGTLGHLRAAPPE